MTLGDYLKAISLGVAGIFLIRHLVIRHREQVQFKQDACDDARYNRLS